MKISWKITHRAVFSAAIIGLGASGALADPILDFYKGKTISYIVGAGAGGGYDTYSRAVARHIGRHIPGKPKVIVKNLPGGGGIRATNLLYNIAPKDGATIGTVSRSMITTPLTGQKAAKFDATKLTWIGSVNKEDSFCIAWKTARAKTWNQLLETPLLVGAPAQGTSMYTFPVMLRNLFGAKFELIAGYPDGGSISLALERGEVQAICPSITSVQSRHPTWLKENHVSPLVIIGLKRDPSMPNVPAVAELAQTEEQKQIIKMILGPQFAGRPVLAPPAIAADRVAALRAAFDGTVRDKAFLAEMQKSKLGVDPASGAEVEALVKDIYAAPKEMVEKMKQVTVKPQDMKVTIKAVPTKTVSAALSKVQKGGRVVVFNVKGKAENAKISGSRTRVTIGGKKAKRGTLKAGMSCKIEYLGSGTEAKSVTCD
ncbi:MAG: tripartite tricarboxylate transporter substrate-binding protein [Alphaproteobacteria bacterium]|nr:tripartite tricarboxylate transporter substrate-binding protein [Alphaproteobacteria bacterium]